MVQNQPADNYHSVCLVEYFVSTVVVVLGGEKAGGTKLFSQSEYKELPGGTVNCP